MKIGIYEQIINQLFEEKISNIDRNRFYKKRSGQTTFHVSHKHL